MAAFLAVLLASTQVMQQATAINIEIELDDCDDNPSWDPTCSILESHFNRAVAIWEGLLTADGDYSFDFEWDSDISGLALATTGIDDYIEVHPNVSWFVDPTPGDDVEFSTVVTQTFGDLSEANQSTFFPSTSPPNSLEVSAFRVGSSSFTNAPGQPNVTASSGFDLLSTIVHEIGHVLGISGVEPGEYNIYPHHVGGLEDVLVLEDSDSGHLAGDGTINWLMCDNCGAPGIRRLPSATDVLVIAEDQGLTDVTLERVGSASSGLWHDSARWTGGKVPTQQQDVFVRHAGSVDLNLDGSSRDLSIFAGNSVNVGSNRLSSHGTLTFDGAQITVGPGGTLAAEHLMRGTGTLIAPSGSWVRFNRYSSSSNELAVDGSLGIGFDNGNPAAVTFEPDSGSIWNIAEQLRIGDDQKSATLLIDGGTTFVSGSGRIGTDAAGEGIVEIDGPGSSWTVNGAVDVGSSGVAGMGGLRVSNYGAMTVHGDLNLFSAGATSHVTVDPNGTLTIDGSIANGPLAEIRLHGGTLRTGKLLPFLPTFDWTDGTLELTDQDVTLDAALPPGPLAASTTMHSGKTLILDGANRTLTIGRSATGTLALAQNASVQVTDGQVVIAENAGSGGNLELLGPNTSLSVHGSMSVGGKVNAPGGQGQLYVAGNATITETLSYWTTSSIIVDSGGTLSADVLDMQGAGQFWVNYDGRVRFNELQGFGPSIVLGGISALGIAETKTGEGSLQRGTGETYSFVQGWIVGDNAPAQVDLVNGGRAVGDGGWVHLGQQLGSAGTIVNVNGTDGAGDASQLLVLSRLDNALTVGVADVATMQVGDGGRVAVSGGTIVAREFSASGSSLIVDGADSFLQTHGDLIVGGGAQGLLSVTDRGTTLTDGTLWIGGAPRKDFGKQAGTPLPSEVLVSGPDSSIRTLQHTIVGFDLSGKLAVQHKAKLDTAQSGIIATDPLSDESGVVVSDEGHWTLGKDLTVGNRARGTLNVETGGVVSVGGDAYLGRGSADGDGTVTLVGNDESQTTLDIAGGLFVGGNQIGPVGRGRVDMEGRTRVRAHTVKVFESGQFDIAGVVEATGGAENRGSLTGQGSILGGLFNVGSVAPSGNIDVESFQQSIPGRLAIELAGTLPANSYDQLNAHQNVALGGTLDIRLSDGYFPAYGDEFTIVTANLVAGVFDDYAGDVYRLGNSDLALLPVIGNNAVTLKTILAGDFNLNGVLDAPDIDMLSAAVRNGMTDPFLDLNHDDLLEQADRTIWVHDLKQTYFGDANLDGLFDSHDVVLVFSSGHYEDGLVENSTWSTGDWDGNGEFDSGDFVLALADGGYEQGPLPALAAVPEPGSIWMAILGITAVHCVRRRVRRQTA